MKKLFTFPDPNLDRQIQEIVQKFNLALPVFADDLAAIAGGLRVGQEYQQPVGATWQVVTVK